MHQWPMTQHVTQTLLCYQSSQHHYGYVMRCKTSPLSVFFFHSHDGGTAQLGSSATGAARGSIHRGRRRQGLPCQHTVLIFQLSLSSFILVLVSPTNHFCPLRPRIAYFYLYASVLCISISMIRSLDISSVA